MRPVAPGFAFFQLAHKPTGMFFMRVNKLPMAPEEDVDVQPGTTHSNT